MLDGDGAKQYQHISRVNLPQEQVSQKESNSTYCSHWFVETQYYYQSLSCTFYFL